MTQHVQTYIYTVYVCLYMLCVRPCLVLCYFSVYYRSAFIVAQIFVPLLL